MMRGTVRLGAIGLAIGLMFTAMAPKDANALTPISIFEFESFPNSVVDDSSFPGQGVVFSVNANDTSQISTFPFDNGFGQVLSNLESPSFGLIVAAQQLGLQVLPFSMGNPGNGDTPAGGPPDTDGETVSAVPEPATWIMMIAGFWIAAWRLRRVKGGVSGPVPA